MATPRRSAAPHPHVRVRAGDLPATGHLTVVSPHLDDAVLSCFALMRAARTATVITVFAGLPPVGTQPAFYDRLTGSADPHRRMAARRREDRAALRLLNAKPVHLDLLDGPYRSGAPERDELVAAIAERVPRRTTLLAVPAGFGTHPDHHAVAAAGPEVAGLLGLDLVAYADYPYAAVYGWPAWVTRTPTHPMLDPEVAWAPVRRRLEPHGLTADTVIDLDRATQQAKVAAFSCYASQVEVCEFGPARMVSGPARLRHELLLTRPG
jgi:LmbE family N-acetylglucosaminyl deacetylase